MEAVQVSVKKVRFDSLTFILKMLGHHIFKESAATTEKSADDTTEKSADDTTESADDIIKAADGDEESAEDATKQTSNRKLKLKKGLPPPRRGSRHYLIETMDI